ncbi:hypothetical protein CQ14_38210 [Bradyrhizobium lablabi]|uniref:Uncharacterized protein n=1 Tax=Bradyrhizobium lablabi TaxID=722472 RepID=A0A0R3N4S3_9BRAD|nr:hypothetical protein CQ14_38210 [Bradyrhizobium lablabi]
MGAASPPLAGDALSLLRRQLLQSGEAVEEWMLRAELDDATQQPEAASALKQPLVGCRQRHSALGFDLRYLRVCRRWQNLLNLRTIALRQRTIEIREVLLESLRHTNSLSVVRHKVVGFRG